MVISAINLYLQPSIYEAKAVLKVKTQDNQILREFNSPEQYSKQSDNLRPRFGNFTDILYS